MCHLFEESVRAVVLIGPKKHKLGRGHWDLASCQVSFQFHSAVSEEKSKNVSANQRPGRPSCFSDWPEKHKLGRGRWGLASCQVSLNSNQRFQRRSRKMSQPIRGQGGHLVFSDQHEKHKLGRRHWDLATCQVSLNSIQRFQRRSRKCLSQSEARAAILFFSIGPKNTNLVEDVEVLLPVKFRWIPISGFRVEVENVSANQRPGRPSCFSDRPEKHKLGRGRWDLASCQVSLNSVQRFSEKKSKMSQPIRGQGGHLVFPISPKNTNLVEDVEVLLPVKFCLNSVQRFQRRSRKMSQPIRGQGGHLVFSDRPEKHKLGRGRWDLPSCKVSSNSVQRFQRRSRKCEKLTTTDGRRTDDGRRTTHDHNSALEPLAQVH